MATMNIFLPDDMRSAVDAQAEARGYDTASEYVRDLIRRDLDGGHFARFSIRVARACKASPSPHKPSTPSGSEPCG